MLFALRDYYDYKHRRGRYSRDPDITGAFEGSLNPALLRVLRPGDVLFVQTLDWPLAWLIMYLTRFEVSHVATYLGNGEIGHATLDGFRIEPIKALYGPGARILPSSWALTDDQRTSMAEMFRNDFPGTPYGWLPVVVKGIRLVSGRDWPSFQWRVFLDVALTLMVIDLPFIAWTGAPRVSWLILAHLILVGFNRLRWPVSPLKLSIWTAKPLDVFMMVNRHGGQFLCDAGPFVVHNVPQASSAQ